MKIKNKIFAFLISAAILLSVLSVPFTGITALANTYWNGTEIAPSANPENPDVYLITSAEELAYVIKTGGGASYKLTADIYLNDTEKVDWTTGVTTDGYIPNVWYNADTTGNFYGTIDGDGHTVYGLYVNSTDDIFAALIPSMRINQTTEIKNLGIDKAYIATGGKSAAFVSKTNYNNTLKVSNSYVGAEVTVKGAYAAAITSYSGSNFVIDSCYSLATIIGTTHGGFVADSWGASRSITNCYFINAPLSSKSGSITVENVYAEDNSNYGNVILRTKENMEGEDALTSDTKMIALADCDAFLATSGYPVLKVFTDLLPEPEIPEGPIWSGKTAKKIAEGSGSKTDPYIIKNGAELAFAVSGKCDVGSYFELANDIYLNDVTNAEWYTAEDVNKWVSSVGFSGHLDGKGYIVYGLYNPDDTTAENAGLIPVFLEGSIKNIGVRNARINAALYAGGIVGKTAIGGLKTISGCFADETVTVAYVTTGNGGAGGILGYAAYEPATETKLKIENCYSKAGITGASKSRINGIIGTAWQCPYILENSYSVGFAPFFANTENLCSWHYKNGKELSEIYKNIYTSDRAATELESFTFVSDIDEMRGEQAKISMSGLDFDTVFETVDGATPKLRIFTSITGEEKDPTGDREAYASGRGTKADPFIIETANQLRYLLQSPNTKGKYYELGADIYLNNVFDKNWKNSTPASWYTSEDSQAFLGHIDGKGHAVYGLYLNITPTPFDPEENKFDKTAAGLFPILSVTASVRNLHIRESFISGGGYVGALVGKLTDTESGEYAEILGCSADATVTVKGQTAGGLVGGGVNRGLKLHASYFTGKVTSTAPDRANGLVGDIWGKDYEILGCYTVGYKPYRYTIIPTLLGANYSTEWATGFKKLDKAQMIGAAAKENMEELDFDVVWNTVENSTPHQKVLASDFVLKVFDDGEKGRVWSGYNAAAYASGEGTIESPYIIKTPEQLAKLVNDTETKGKYYRLDANIILNNTSKKNWQNTARQWFAGTNEFAGNFDGNGYVVSGIYFDTEYTYAGLFQQVTSGAVIKRLGITESYIKVRGEENNASYAGGIIGRVTGWTVGDFVAPIMSQCFVDHTVSIDAYNAGGLVGGCGMNMHIDNCYFAGLLTSEHYAGQAVANAWNTTLAITITDSYFVSDSSAPLSGHPTGASMMELKGVYHRGTRGNVNGAISIASMLIRGDKAKTVMPELDFVNIWKTVENGTPVLRCFEGAENYSLTELPSKVEISFASMEGTAFESIYGYPMHTELKVSDLPVPTRYGYAFGGWYHSVNLSVPVKDGLFPDFDTVFYAKWVSVGFTEDFDGNLDPEYDYNSSIESFRPGVKGYNPFRVHNGLKSIHTLPSGEEAPRFLISYKHSLEKGQMYDISFYIMTDDDSISSAKLKLYHANHPQFDSDMVGYEEISIDTIKKSEWTKVTLTITANAPYLVFETEIGKSLFFDTAQVVPLGKTGELGQLNATTDDNASFEPDEDQNDDEYREEYEESEDSEDETYSEDEEKSEDNIEQDNVEDSEDDPKQDEPEDPEDNKEQVDDDDSKEKETNKGFPYGMVIAIIAVLVAALAVAIILFIFKTKKK